jgi:hypothetical protein
MVLSLSVIRDKLSKANIALVAKSTGLHYNTVYKIARGGNINPSLDTVIKLSDFIIKYRM